MQHCNDEQTVASAEKNPIINYVYIEESCSETSTVESYSTVNVGLLTPIRSRSASETSGSHNEVDNKNSASKNTNYLSENEPSSVDASAKKINKSIERPCSSATEHNPVNENQEFHRNVTLPLLSLLQADNLDSAHADASSSNVKQKLSHGGKFSNSSSSPSIPSSYSYYQDTYQHSALAGSSASSATIVEKSREELFSSESISFKSNTSKLYIPSPQKSAMDKPNKVVRKKKRSASWYNIWSPSYKQKNDSFHKCFKQLPETERLLVDYSCALMKDLIVQGRLYVSQNYVCFHSTILKWQTDVIIKFRDIEQMTKEKTVKVIPNAIQFQIRGKEKSPTFTSFTQRDRTYQQIYKLWQNALNEKPMTSQELWGHVRSHYGTDLGCSSDEDYVGPEHIVTDDLSKKKRTKKLTPSVGSETTIQNGFASQPMEQSPELEHSSQDSKISSQESTNGLSEKSSLEDCNRIETFPSDDDEPSDHVKDDLDRTYLIQEFPVSAKQLFETIFGESGFWKRYLEGKRCTDIDFEAWQKGCDDYEGSQLRNLSFNIPLTNPLIPKSSHVEELQVLYKESEPGRSYAVDCIARTFGVPYADYFSTVMRYAIRKTSRSTAELKVTAQVKFHKTPWGLVKNFIDKNVHTGMEENFELLERELVAHFDRTKRLRPAVRRSNRTRKVSHSPSSAKTSVTGANPQLSAEENKDHKENVEVRDSIDFTTAPSTEVHSLSPCFKKNLSDKKINGKVKNDASSEKWLWRFFAFIFFLLLWSNYSMYCRITVLEHLQSNIPLDGDSTRDIIDNCVYDVNQAQDYSVAKGLRSVQVRLNVLEQLVRNLTTTSNRQWSSINSRWKELEKTVVAFINHIKSKDPT